MDDDGDAATTGGRDPGARGEGGLVCTLPASGTLRGEWFTVAVTQPGRTANLADMLVRRKGTLTASMSGRDVAGQRVKGRLTRAEPAP